MKFKYQLTGIQSVSQNKPWYWGFSYQKFGMDVTVYHLVPINFIIRIVIRLGHLWDILRLKPPNYVMIEKQNIHLKKTESRLYSEMRDLKQDLSCIVNGFINNDTDVVVKIIEKHRQ